MLTFLFWNVRNNPVEEIIARLVRQHQVDIVILAESAIIPARMLPVLNRNDEQWKLTYSNCQRISIYTRFKAKFTKPVFEDESSARMSIRRPTLPGRPELLLVAAHFPSKLYKDDASQDFDMVPFAKRIREMERRVQHDRTLMVGDLNMNPFAHGVVAATALHGVLSRSVAEEGKRSVNQQSYPYFYNPMWGHFGHTNDGPPGTYYRRGANVSYFWHIFDQVLLRPSLLPYFRDRDLKILDGDGVISFVSKAKSIPRANEVSDHLPILFRLDL